MTGWQISRKPKFSAVYLYCVAQSSVPARCLRRDLLEVAALDRFMTGHERL